ncbi:MAG: tetratricopeptide repeat protein [Pseudomonadota bacterium]
MANEESLLREVNEGLAEDSLANTLQSRLPLIIGGAIAIVAVVAGYQIYAGQKVSVASQAARSLSAILNNETAGPEERATELSQVIETSPAGYAALARLRLAASQAATGSRQEALATYRAISKDGGVTNRVRDLASIRAAYLALDDGRSVVIDTIGDLETDTSPLGYFAREVLALAALKDGDYQTAKSIFSEISMALDAPASVRQRSSEFAALAAAGAENGELEWPNLGAKTPPSATSIIDALGDDLSGALERRRQNGSDKTISDKSPAENSIDAQSQSDDETKSATEQVETTDDNPTN